MPSGSPIPLGASKPTRAKTGVFQADARELTAWFRRLGLEQPFIATTITSPPYGHLKDYGSPHQIGWAQTYEHYLRDCRDVLDSVFTHTLDSGTLWMVVDSLRLPEPNQALWRLEPLPFHLADEAAKAGWVLRDVVIWEKDRTTPWSGRGRLRNTFEYVLQFVKGPNYKYHLERIRNPARLEEWWVRFPERYHPLGKVPSNVWKIPIPRQGAWQPNVAAQHACPLPAELIERLVLLSSDVGDVVFDPFAGIGSVAAHAERLGRIGVGTELNPDYIKAFEKHVRPHVAATSPAITDSERADLADGIGRKLITLRTLKLPRTLYEQIKREVADGELPVVVAMAALARVGQVKQAPSGSWASARIIVASRGRERDRRRLKEALSNAAGRSPASKFGIAVSVDVVAIADFARAVGRKRLYSYPRGRTWRTEGSVSTDVALEQVLRESASRRPTIPVILSNLFAAEEPHAIG